MNHLLRSKKVASVVVAAAVGLVLIGGSASAYAEGAGNEYPSYPPVDRLLPSQLPATMQPAIAANAAIAGLTDRDGDHDGKTLAMWHGRRSGGHSE
jgi:hypothetical protein